MSGRSLLAVAMLLPTLATAAEPKREAKVLPVAGETFYVEASQAFVIDPPNEKRAKPRPWVWYAPTLPGLPDRNEIWMIERFRAAGVAFAGVDVGESFGSPAGQARYSQFYDQMKSRGYSSKPVLLARSRGGLMLGAWASAHPESVGGFAGIYPVLSFRSYPGIDKAAGAYSLSPQELDRQSARLDPIERLAALAKARVPVFLIHGDVDTVVPLEQNSAALRDRYEAAGAGGLLKLVVPKGQGHNAWEGFFQCRELADFAIQHARSEAK